MSKGAQISTFNIQPMEERVLFYRIEFICVCVRACVRVCVILSSCAPKEASYLPLVQIPFLQVRKTGPEVIKLFSCSTQLSMKFALLINLKLLTKCKFFVAEVI